MAGKMVVTVTGGHMDSDDNYVVNYNVSFRDTNGNIKGRVDGKTIVFSSAVTAEIVNNAVRDSALTLDPDESATVVLLGGAV